MKIKAGIKFKAKRFNEPKDPVLMGNNINTRV